MKAKVLTHYYETCEQFQHARQDFLAHLERYADELATLLTEEFEILTPAF